MNENDVCILNALEKCKIIPVVTINNVKQAVNLARDLQKSGYGVVEITLRTEQALAAISAIKKSVPDLLLGAGTVTTTQNVSASISAGSDFIVTPATSSHLLSALKQADVPVFPGISTPSEALEMYNNGFEYLKFFPAEAKGGIKFLQSIYPPLPKIKFMPTGGIDTESAEQYLSLPNVFAIGGSWMLQI